MGGKRNRFYFKPAVSIFKKHNYANIFILNTNKHATLT